MPLTDAIWLLSDLTDAQRTAIAELIYKTWPKPEKNVAHRCEQLKAIAAAHAGTPEIAPRAFVVLDGEQLIANAIIEPRTIGTPQGDLTILGLGKVCSDPTRRGQGLGARVVQAAFAMVDAGHFPFALFQTTAQVRSFYERLGCQEIDNTVVNAKNPDAVVHPFADEVVMRYPSGDGWPEGKIDLRGPGY